MEDTCFNIHSLALNMYIKPQFCARTLIGVSLRDLQGAYTERLFEVTSYVFLQKPEQLILLRKWIVLATAGGVYKYATNKVSINVTFIGNIFGLFKEGNAVELSKMFLAMYIK